MRPVTPDLIAARAAYIQRWGGHLDLHFGHIDVVGKRVFVLGGGWGGEALWALKRGASEVVSVDPQGSDRQPFDLALEQQQATYLGSKYIQLAGTTLDLPAGLGPFDVAITNNVLEHVFGLSANLVALRALLPNKGARIHVHTDPLFYSSLGHHLPIGPWEHLSLSQSEVRSKVGPYQWAEYRDGLNGMTINDLLAAIREAGLVLVDLSITPDPHLDSLPDRLTALPPGIKPLDLALAGVRCTMAFPHNL